jgi:hypothetical protein
MTDARVSRVHVEALAPSTLEARLSRLHTESLVDPGAVARLSRLHVEALWSDIPDVQARLSRAHAESLLVPITPDARVAQQFLEVLWGEEYVAWVMTEGGPTPMFAEAYDDGTGPQLVKTLGWWDGATAQPLTPP